MSTLNSQSPPRRPWFLTPKGLFTMAFCLLLLGASVVGFAYLQHDQPEAAKPSPTATGAAQTACDHPYFPLRTGAVWRYSGQVSAGEQTIAATTTWRVTEVRGDQNHATATVIVDHDYDSGTYVFIETITFSCGDQGIFRSGSILSAGEMNISQYDVRSGAYLPAPNSLAPGFSWEHLYTIITNDAPSGTDYAWEYRATAVEEIEAGAGTFDALRVEGTRKKTGSSESYFSREWFAYGVGQVRSERVQNENGTDAISTLLLSSYEVP